MLLNILISVLPPVAAAFTLDFNSYDYIVVGGGTCGLVVANRLSEHADTSVLVIEAGDEVFDNFNVTDIGGYGRALGTSIDWQYKTVQQAHGNNKVQILHAGRALGGTSTINGMSYTRAEAAQIDAWEEAGNPGWTWNALYPYYLKSEQYQMPSVSQANGGASYDAKFHGFSGPVKVGYPNNQAVNEFPSALNRSYQSLGLPYSVDVNGGSMRSFVVYPKTVDEQANVRADAAHAYIQPISAARPNLHLLLNTTATRIIWGKPKDPEGNVVATAVEVMAAKGAKRLLNARQEVVLSAGALRTPSLLELSGVGNPEILAKANVEITVALPGVGENLVDQTNNGLTFPKTSAQEYTGSAGYAAYPNVTDVFGPSASAFASSVLAALPSYASAVASQNSNATTAEDLLSLFRLQHSLIFESQVPVAELLHYPAGHALGSQFWSTLPFSRGNVHIASSNPAVPARINPNYFMLQYDVQSQVAIARWMRRLFKEAPLADISGAEAWPGTTTVPAGASDETWTKWLKQNYRANYHFLSTAAMMPREKGGVVSERLKVWGTANVRVVDASALPFQVCGHLMSTLYAVAERASDFIKEDGGLQ